MTVSRPAVWATMPWSCCDKGIYNRVVATKAESIVDYDISVALSMYKTIDTTLLDIGSTISI